MERERGVYLYKVSSTGGRTKLVHGYFSNFQAAERYVNDLYYSNTPLCDLIEMDPQKAENSNFEINVNGFHSDIPSSYTWKQKILHFIDEYGDIYSEAEEIGSYAVYVEIAKEHMYINEGMFEVASQETISEWLEKHGATTRTVNCMARVSGSFGDSIFKYKSIYFLADHAYELPSVRNLGRKSMEEILSILDREGIKYTLEKPKYGEVRF